MLKQYRIKEIVMSQKIALFVSVFVLTFVFIFLVAPAPAGLDLGSVELKDFTAYSAEDDQNIGVLTRELYVLRQEYVAIDEQRRVAMEAYEAQLHTKQLEIEAKELELLNEQVK